LNENKENLKERERERERDGSQANSGKVGELQVWIRRNGSFQWNLKGIV
jgi:hypothetical protein